MLAKIERYLHRIVGGMKESEDQETFICKACKESKSVKDSAFANNSYIICKDCQQKIDANSKKFDGGNENYNIMGEAEQYLFW